LALHRPIIVRRSISLAWDATEKLAERGRKWTFRHQKQVQILGKSPVKHGFGEPLLALIRKILEDSVRQ
jgi:hypothetical protein